MSLINPDITLGTMGRGTDGFTFSVLGGLASNGADYTRRSQGNNPVFVGDYAGNPFIANVEYKFEVYHPVYAPDRPLLRYTFDANGNLVPSSPAEDAGNAPGQGGDESLDTTGGRSTFVEITAPDQFAAYQRHPNRAGKVLVRGMSAATAASFLQFPLAKYTREITPQMFGATGHPLGNDTQALIAWITTGGDYIHTLPAGTYNCSTSLDRYNLGALTIRGAGAGKSILAFSGDTAGLVVVNNTLIYTGGIVVLEDFTVTSTGPKTGYNDAVYLTTKQQRPGPAIRGVKVISQVAGQEWKTGLHFHNCSGIIATDFDIEGLGTAMGNQFAVQITADPENTSVEHTFARFGIRNLKQGFDIHSPQTGPTGIEGIIITDGNIVGVQTGIVAVSRQASPGFFIDNTHINTFGGEALHLDGFQQIKFDGALFYVNPGSGLSPAATPQYGVFVKDAILCTGDATIVTYGNTLHQFYFAGAGGGVDMDINSIVVSARTNTIFVEPGIGSRFGAPKRLWTRDETWGTEQGEWIASDLNAVLSALSVVGTAINPPDKHIVQYNAGKALYEANSMIRAKALSTTLVSDSAVIDPSKYELVRVNNGASDVVMVIDRTKYTSEGGETLTFERYDQTCTGIITIQTNAPSANQIQRFDRKFAPTFIWPFTARQKTVTFWNNTVQMEMMDGQGDQAWSTIVISASTTIDPSKYNLVRINNGAQPIVIQVDATRFVEAGGQEIVFSRLNETSTGIIQIQTTNPNNQRIQDFDGTIDATFLLPTTAGQRSVAFWWTTVNLEMLPGGGGENGMASGNANPSPFDKASGFPFLWKNLTNNEIRWWLNDNGTMKAMSPFVTQTTPVIDDLSAFIEGPDYEEVEVVVPVTPDYLIKLDFNACDAIAGWVIDKNNKLTPAQVDVTVDGTLLTTLTANVVRADVRDLLISQGILPAGTTFATYGFTLAKDATYATGTPHTWRVFGHNSTTESTTDTSAPATITCGTAYRITDAAHSASLTVSEGSALQLRVEQQAGSDPWSVSNRARSWLTIGSISSATISATGLLSIPANTISQNTDITVQATFEDFSVISATVHVINQPDN